MSQVASTIFGLSPRVRGSLRRAASRAWLAGSIPAGAGEPNPVSDSGNVTPVYPRVCGGACPSYDHHDFNAGLSPRVRGSQSLDTQTATGRRSIPACAGEP